MRRSALILLLAAATGLGAAGPAAAAPTTWVPCGTGVATSNPTHGGYDESGTGGGPVDPTHGGYDESGTGGGPVDPTHGGYDESGTGGGPVDPTHGGYDESGTGGGPVDPTHSGYDESGASAPLPSTGTRTPAACRKPASRRVEVLGAAIPTPPGGAPGMAVGVGLVGGLSGLGLLLLRRRRTGASW
jgi:hypothetical protein